MQLLEVMTDGRLAQVEGVVEVAHAGLAVGMGCHQRQQAQSNGIGQRFEQRHDLFSMFIRQWLAHQWRAADRRLDRSDLDFRLRHPSILTDIDVLLLAQRIERGQHLVPHCRPLGVCAFGAGYRRQHRRTSSGRHRDLDELLEAPL